MKHNIERYDREYDLWCIKCGNMWNFMSYVDGTHNYSIGYETNAEWNIKNTNNCWISDEEYRLKELLR